MLEDLVIDLRRARQLGVIDLPGQFGERLAIVSGPSGPRLGGNVVQQMIEAMIAEARRFQRPVAKCLLQIGLEIRVQAILFAFRRERGSREHREHQQTQRQASEREFHEDGSRLGSQMLLILAEAWRMSTLFR